MILPFFIFIIILSIKGGIAAAALATNGSLVIEISRQRTLMVGAYDDAVPLSSLASSSSSSTSLLHFDLTRLDQHAEASDNLWLCHDLQPLPYPHQPHHQYSNTACSLVSTSTPSPPPPPSHHHLSLMDEAAGQYKLTTFLATTTDAVGPITVDFGAGGISSFTYNYQISPSSSSSSSSSSLSSEAAAAVRSFCTLIKDKMSQRVEGCTQKILAQVRYLAGERLLQALRKAEDQGKVIQHVLTLEKRMLEDQHVVQLASSSSSAATAVLVDETRLSGQHQQDLCCLEDKEEEEEHHQAEAAILDQIELLPPSPSSSGIRLLCLTYTYEPHHSIQLQAILETWAGDCDGYLAISNHTDASKSALALPHQGPESYFNMWQKVRSLWKEVYEKYGATYDYFYLGGDDLYLIPQNLKALLLEQADDYDEEVYLGRSFHGEGPDDGLLYNSGGAGYVLSRQTLKRLVQEGLPSRFCRPHVEEYWEDVNIGYCLRYLGILPGVTVDRKGRQRFHHFNPLFLLKAGRVQEISSTSVSFHYLSAKDIRRIHHRLYCYRSQQQQHLKQQQRLKKQQQEEDKEQQQEQGVHSDNSSSSSPFCPSSSSSNTCNKSKEKVRVEEMKSMGGE